MSSTLSSKTFKLSLFEQDPDAPRRAVRRVVINADVLKASKLSTGDLVAVTGSENKFAVGVAWPSLELAQDVVAISTSLILTLGAQLGSIARVVPLSGANPSLGLPSAQNAKEARVVRLCETFINNGASPAPRVESKGRDRDWLQLALREALVDLKYVTNDQVVELESGGKRRFRIVSIQSTPESHDLSSSIQALSLTSSSPRLWTVTWDSSVYLSSDEPEGEKTKATPAFETLAHISTDSAYSTVGGLDQQIQIVRDLLEIPLTRPDLFRYFGLKPPKGILLHGPPGTGKTHLARAIASSTRSSVLVINGPELSSAYHGETEAKLRDVFKQAREKSPCIVVLDEVDALVPRREEGGGGEVEKRVVATLLTILDGIDQDDDSGGVVIIGTTNRPNAIDPALRRPGRFDREIEIGVPNADARISILQVLLRNVPHDLSTEDLRTLGSKLHGYVGAEINAVVREAGTIAIKRHVASGSTDKSPLLHLSDLVSALPSIRPSAMRAVFVESPHIRYADIGGQASVIEKLKEAVEWPLLHPEAFQRLGVRPPKGILLYGPPGCSKTVLARACASESGVNFLAVKGPELLNKFVGESERAVREIFRKARAAAPSIIFFDEIDALAMSRMASDSDMGSSHEGVLTSLLNEMDGVQELTGVTVVAATNRPEALDSALMRPGRLDRILYVGPPDFAGRKEILGIKTRSMTVDPTLDIDIIAQVTEGFSGAELTAMCQEAAILTMKKDINAPYVAQDQFVAAAKATRRQITPEVLQKFARWRDSADARPI